MLIALGLTLLMAWTLRFVVYHVTFFAIPLLLIAAVISLVLDLFGGRRAGI